MLSLRFEPVTFTLRLDGGDAVVGVDDEWNEFVAEHRVGALGPVEAGTPFYESVQGGRAAAMYEIMIERARARHRVAFDIRAAAPDLLKGFELGLLPHGFDGEVDLQLRFLYERPLQDVTVFDPAVERDDSELRVCVFCHRIFAFDWSEPEFALDQLRIDSTGPQPRLSASVCSSCEDAVYANCGATRLGI